MRKKQSNLKNFFILPNEIFNMGLDTYSFMVYAYLVSCAGMRKCCWPSLETMHRKLGIAISTIKDRLVILEKRKFISIEKHYGVGKYKNNLYHILPLDNPDIYRDINAIDEPGELPLFVG